MSSSLSNGGGAEAKQVSLDEGQSVGRGGKRNKFRFTRAERGTGREAKQVSLYGWQSVGRGEAKQVSLYGEVTNSLMMASRS